MAKRPVFEEVSDPGATTRPVARTGMIDAAPKGARRAIRVWLMVLFVMVAAMIAIQICEAIGHAHSLQIIHRDLKPENIMVSEDGSLKLMDFGIAKVIDQQQQMTLTGTILGSPAHMAPELLEGKELDFRSDVFSLGTIIYWLATGHMPFAGKNPHQVIKQIVHGTYSDPQQVNPVVGDSLARIIRRALEQSPDDRYN